VEGKDRIQFQLLYPYIVIIHVTREYLLLKSMMYKRS